MHDENRYLRSQNDLRSQYEKIIQHCEYILGNSIDERLLARVRETKQRAEKALARLIERVNKARTIGN
jgi:hypothetical protein